MPQDSSLPREGTRTLGSRIALWAFVLLSIASVLAEVRPFTDVGERTIGHADAAHVAIVARNILHGEGAVSDVVWLLHGGGPAGPEIRHPEGYWSIYQAAALALFFALFGARAQAVLLMASLSKVVIAGLGYHLVRRFGGSSLAALTCGLLLLSSPEMTQQLSARSDMSLCLGMFLAVVCQVWALERPSARRWALCGLLTGLCIGLKPTGLLLVGLVAAGTAVAPDWRRNVRHLWAWGLAALFALAPLAVHNLQAAGTVLWPDFGVMRSALLHVDLERPPGRFIWDQPTRSAWYEAAYDPGTGLRDLDLGLRGTLEHRIGNLKSFAFYLLVLSQPVPVWVLLLAAIAIVRWLRGIGERFLRRWRRREAAEAGTRMGSTYGSFVGTSCLLFLGGVVLAAHVHTETRYFTFLLPPLAVVALVEASRLSRLLVACGLAGVLVMAGLSYPEQTRLGVETWNLEQYAQVDRSIPEGAPIMTPNPWESSFHLRRPAVVLPYTDDWRVVREVADRFGVEYLVVVHGDARHPGMSGLNRGELPAFLACVHKGKNLLVARFLEPGEMAVVGGAC